LRAAHPQNAREFFAVANQHMRWELNDLARRLDNQPAAGELHDGIALSPPSSVSRLTPNGLRMLHAIEELPDDEREVFDLVRIQGMTQVDAAEALAVSNKTVQRRLNRALLILSETLDDLRPNDD
jgi:RNA polymerase sigma factor (sigma-70 family)